MTDLSHHSQVQPEEPETLEDVQEERAYIQKHSRQLQKRLEQSPAQWMHDRKQSVRALQLMVAMEVIFVLGVLFIKEPLMWWVCSIGLIVLSITVFKGVYDQKLQPASYEDYQQQSSRRLKQLWEKDEELMERERELSAQRQLPDLQKKGQLTQSAQDTGQLTMHSQDKDADEKAPYMD